MSLLPVANSQITPLYKMNLGTGGSYVPTRQPGSENLCIQALTSETLPGYLNYLQSENTRQFGTNLDVFSTGDDDKTKIFKVGVQVDDFGWTTEIHANHEDRWLSQTTAIEYEYEDDDLELTNPKMSYKTTQLSWTLLSAEAMIYLEEQGLAKSSSERSQRLLNLFLQAAIEIFQPKNGDGRVLNISELAQILFDRGIITKDENGVIRFYWQHSEREVEFFDLETDGIDFRDLAPGITINPDAVGLRLGLYNTQTYIEQFESINIPTIFLEQTGFWDSDDLPQDFAAVPLMAQLIEKYFMPLAFIHTDQVAEN